MEPWQVGTEDERWQAYLDLDHYDGYAGDYVLVNRVGATDYDQLREREDQFVTARLAMMPAEIPSSFDLTGLQEIHRYLFQDVYDWAGELRTVTISKGDGSFAPPGQITASMRQVSDYLASRSLLGDVSADQMAGVLARTYNAVNAIHPFREGNGRAQREFITAIARTNGYTIDWTRIDEDTNIDVCELGRHGDLAPLEAVFSTMVTHTPTPNTTSDAAQAVSATGSQTRQRLEAAAATLSSRPARTPAHVVPDRAAPMARSAGYSLGC